MWAYSGVRAYLSKWVLGKGGYSGVGAYSIILRYSDKAFLFIPFLRPSFQTQYQTHKLNTDTLKGALTKMAVLPMNHLYLFGVDNGNLVLYS